eukprot:2559128-Ditylum_brightwellii.AAC.1
MEQAEIAAESGTVIGLEQIPTDINCNGRVSPMPGPAMILGIENAAAKARIRHFVKTDHAILATLMRAS